MYLPLSDVLARPAIDPFGRCGTIYSEPNFNVRERVPIPPLLDCLQEVGVLRLLLPFGDVVLDSLVDGLSSRLGDVHPGKDVEYALIDILHIPPGKCEAFDVLSVRRILDPHSAVREVTFSFLENHDLKTIDNADDLLSVFHPSPLGVGKQSVRHALHYMAEHVTSRIL